MTDLEYLIALNSISDVGFIRFSNLMKRFGSPKDIFEASRAQLEAVDKIGPKIADGILSCDKEKTLGRELKLIDKYGVKAVSYLDEGYPGNLKEIYDPPVILYVKGDIVPEDKYAVAIVGSRNASRYGTQTAERLGYELAVRGFTVASGLARGVDASGHKGALMAKGRTLAVLGSGLAEIYPPEHLGMAEDIAKSGAVVSEFPMAMPPHKDNFPRRNRIISGLSLGVVVVEAAKNSGALITADFALEQGRELFAVPGQARAMTSFGTNALIRQGAKLVESADDIIEELGGVVKGHLKAAHKKEGKPVLTAKLNGSEEKVFNATTEEPKSVDEIIEYAALAASEITGCLTRLELKGLVERLPGKLYVRKT